MFYKTIALQIHRNKIGMKIINLHCDNLPILHKLCSCIDLEKRIKNKNNPGYTKCYKACKTIGTSIVVRLLNDAYIWENSLAVSYC